MATTCDETINSMIESAPEKTAAMEQQVTAIEEEQERLAEEAAAIEECVTDKAKDELRAYLEGPKLAELSLIYPPSGLFGPLYIVFGPTFGVIDYDTGNITDWVYRQDIIPAPIPPLPTYVDQYSYVPNLNFDGDPTIIELAGDFDFGNDYITHPLGIGASYGLDPLYDAYQQGKNTILGNKQKIEDSIDVFRRYVT